jgi:hypothetical protein
MATKYTKLSQNIPNGHKTYQHLPVQDPPKFTPIGIFGLRANHPATLDSAQVYELQVRTHCMYCTYLRMVKPVNVFKAHPKVLRSVPESGDVARPSIVLKRVL